METKNIIHLALTFDENYLVQFYVVMTSLFVNNVRHRFNVHVIATGLSAQEKEELSRYMEINNSEILFYNIDLNRLSTFTIPAVAHFALANYYRLFLINLLPHDIKKILYIDTDIVTNGDISQLYATELGSSPVAAAVESAFLVYENLEIPAGLGITDKNKYFNSGVLLINVKEWKSQDISERAIVYIQKFPERIKYMDQDGLNAVLIDNWVKLDKKYNVMPADLTQANVSSMTSKALNEFAKDKVVIHFTGPEKPWNYDCSNRLRYLYSYYLSKSPKAQQRNAYNSKVVSAALKIRLRELYFEFPFFARVWRKAKSIL